MRTPKEYTQNLKQKIITKQMLSDCLFSVNKRAKNCRDNEHKYSKYRTDYYGNADNYRQQKEEYYSQKDKMLTLLKPNCIHETTEYHKERVYDYEPEYYEIYDSGNYLRSSGNELAAVRISAICGAMLSNNSLECKNTLFL